MLIPSTLSELHAAALWGLPDMVKLILKKGCDVD